jgi:hypothetical protein
MDLKGCEDSPKNVVQEECRKALVGFMRRYRSSSVLANIVFDRSPKISPRRDDEVTALTSDFLILSEDFRDPNGWASACRAVKLAPA